MAEVLYDPSVDTFGSKISQSFKSHQTFFKASQWTSKTDNAKKNRPIQAPKVSKEVHFETVSHE